MPALLLAALVALALSGCRNREASPPPAPASVEPLVSEDPALQATEAKAAEMRRSIQENVERERARVQAEKAEKAADPATQLTERLKVIPPDLIRANALRCAQEPGGCAPPAEAPAR